MRSKFFRGLFIFFNSNATVKFVLQKHFANDQFENNRADQKRPLRWNAVPTIFSHKKKLLDELMSTPEQEETNSCILELKRKLNLAQKRARKLNEEVETLKKQVQAVFNEDQIDFLKRGTMIGRQWHTDTIKNCLNYPLPCIRTLQKRIEMFKFRPGILHDLFRFRLFSINAEILFRKECNKLLDGRLTLKCLTSAFINIGTNSLPKCHNIFQKIFTIYFRTRLYFLLRKRSDELNKSTKESLKCGSRSIGMRIAVKKV